MSMKQVYKEKKIEAAGAGVDVGRTPEHYKKIISDENRESSFDEKLDSFLEYIDHDQKKKVKMSVRLPGYVNGDVRLVSDYVRRLKTYPRIEADVSNGGALMLDLNYGGARFACADANSVKEVLTRLHDKVDPAGYLLDSIK